MYMMNYIHCESCNQYKPQSQCQCHVQTIEPVVLNQGPHKGISYKNIENIPNLEIAVLSNERCDETPSSVITLNPILLCWCDFLTLFYNNQHNFVVSPSNIFNTYITFNCQTYENVSKTMKYNLAEQVRNAWATKCETMSSNIPIKKNILLNKDAFLIRSLASACSLTALSLDEALNTLIDNNQIVPGSYNTEAVVQFIVSYKYKCKPLDTCVQVNFMYLTHIPHYQNVNDCGGDCPPYYYYSYAYYYSNSCGGLFRNTIDISQEEDLLSYIKDDFFITDCDNDETVSDISSKW